MRVSKGIAVAGAVALMLAVTALVVPAVSARKSKMEAAAAKDRLFDHARHGETVKVSCNRCHEASDDGLWVKSGKKEHARCFSCHKFSSSCSVLQKKEGRVCLTCHTTFKSTCIPAGYVKPEANKAEFTATYSHRLHIRPRANTGKQCENCHGDFGAAAPKVGTLSAGHGLCSGCHARGVSPRIKESCDGCHLDIKTTKAPVVVAKEANPFSVKGAFDHKAHASIGRVGTAGKACLSCHQNIKEAESDHVIPLPTMQSCEKACHDGEKAFDAVGTTCTRCHTKGAK
jgi:predicted CXXCH cytochrome family protein